MRIALGTDHAGFALKEVIKGHLATRGHEVVDCGCHGDESCDYPDFVGPAARMLGAGEVDRAIVLGGSGNGEAIVANRVRGVRCALCWNHQTAIWGREHNDANALAIGGRTVDQATCLEIVDLWLDTPFAGGRHARRVAKIDRETLP